MKNHVPYEDAIDLLDADHKAVKKLFLNYAALCGKSGSVEVRFNLAQSICRSLTVHSRLEEEIFYPLVVDATGNQGLLEEALDDHAQADAIIDQIKAMGSGDPELDNAVKKLKKLVDQHVMQEREQIFLEARYAAVDLREMAVPLFARQLELKAQTDSRKEAA